VVVGIILLFIGTAILPSNGQNIEKTSSSISRDDILYVGGSGPGNYTRIQDAINDSDTGDTVFVYDDSSPYYGVLVVDRSISLVGENNISTVIDGHSSQDVITVLSEGVTISSFTIQNSASIDVPNINIKSNSVSIINNIIRHGVREGIRLWGVKDILIANNTFKDDIFPIYLRNSKDISIMNNVIYTISNSGILSDNSKNLFVSGNTFYNSFAMETDVKLFEIENVVIKRNTFHSLYGGIFLECCKNCTVSENNFLNKNCTLTFLYLFPPCPRKNNDIFDNNYWYKPRNLPKLIVGVILPRNDLLIYLILGSSIFPPYFKIDWHPAKQPFDSTR
jgi:nitrous oxidase accessory protein NosD